MRGHILSIACAAALLGAGGERACGQQRFEASYRATLAGLPVGSGSVVLDIAGDRYAMEASGQAMGLMRMFASGSGEATARGAISGGKFLPASYALNIRTRNKIQEVKMALVGGAVQRLVLEPPFEPSTDHAPLTEAHKRGVLDPLSASIVAGAGPNGLAPEACQRRMPVFDGRMRFDLTLAYKRIETVRTAQGYEGPAIVCAVTFTPIGGHEKEKFAIKFLRENRDMEIWFAPIAGTPFLAVYRIAVPTMLGPAVLQATRFVAGRTTQTGAAGARTQ